MNRCNRTRRDRPLHFPTNNAPAQPGSVRARLHEKSLADFYGQTSPTPFTRPLHHYRRRRHYLFIAVVSKCRCRCPRLLSIVRAGRMRSHITVVAAPFNDTIFRATDYASLQLLRPGPSGGRGAHDLMHGVIFILHTHAHTSHIRST